MAPTPVAISVSRQRETEIDVGAIVILRFEDGRIAESWNFIDQLAFYQQHRILNVR